MKPNAEEQFRIANETLREMEQLLAGGLYEAVAKRTYHAIQSAAAAALLAKGVQIDASQVIIAEFNDTFVKTGLFDEKVYKYFRQAFNNRDDCGDSSFASMDHGQAQANLFRAREFIAACRVLCD